MRKPRDFDSELKALADKAKQLKERRVQQRGELVIATGADATGAETLAGALLVIAQLGRDVVEHGVVHCPKIGRDGAGDVVVRPEVDEQPVRISRDVRRYAVRRVGQLDALEQFASRNDLVSRDHIIRERTIVHLNIIHDAVYTPCNGNCV